MENLPGMTKEDTKRMTEALETLLKHGWGQLVLIVSDGRVSAILPAPSIKLQVNSEQDAAINYQQERKLRRGK